VGDAIRAVVVACCGAVLGCATGDGDFDNTPGPAFGEGSGTTAGGSATFEPDRDTQSSSTGNEGDEDPLPPDLGACAGDDDCVLTDDSCFEPLGVCVDNGCTFAPKLAGVACDDMDPCTDQDVCNGVGGCLGAAVGCMVPNGIGTCNAGMCVAIECEAGWGDCNMQDADGCETALDSATDCGECGRSCEAGAHGSAACAAGECTLACDAPWEDCDGDASNGCEIPTGVPNQCDANGLNATSGCWTAHCGSSNNAAARNFGSWFCFECTTCHVPGAALCQWCSHDTGTWYPADECPCGTYEDLECNP
jgi:hypothetical protein